HAGRLETDRAYARGDVSSPSGPDEPFADRRSCALSAYFERGVRGVQQKMSAILVQIPGLFTTVQDLGRESFGPIGVSASGAADPVSLRIGNRLVGNPQGAAGLEMTRVRGPFRSEQ